MPVLTFENADEVLKQCGIKRRVVGNDEETEKELMRLWDIAKPLMQDFFLAPFKGAQLARKNTPESRLKLAKLGKDKESLLQKTRDALVAIAEIAGLEPFMKTASEPGNEAMGAALLSLIMKADVGMPMSKDSPEGRAYLQNEELGGLRKKRKLDD
jgi:hypothetical protein